MTSTICSDSSALLAAISAARTLGRANARRREIKSQACNGSSSSFAMCRLLCTSRSEVEMCRLNGDFDAEESCQVGSDVLTTNARK